jgi:hypothetical protein
LTIFVYKHYEGGEKDRLYTAFILATIGSWVYSLCYIWQNKQILNFELTIRVAVVTQHCIEVPVDIQSNTLDERIYPAYNLQ